MRFISSIVIFICLVIFILGPASASLAADKKKPAPETSPTTIPPPGKDLQKKKTEKIASFLAVLDKAGSVEQVAQSFESLSFTQKELDELEDAVKKPVYARKLDQLKQKKASEAVSDSRQTKNSGLKKTLVQMKTELDQNQKNTLKALNQQAAGFLSRPVKHVKITMRNRGNTSQAVPAPEATMLFNQASRPQTNVVITQLRPGTGIIGQTLVILGNGFGITPGMVSIALTDPDNRVAYYCNVRFWTDNQIEVTIPLEFESNVSFSRDGARARSLEDSFLCIFPSGNDPGACHPFTIGLDRNRFAPEISNLSSEEIRPGQQLVVTGNHLAPAGVPPRVVFYFGREIFDRIEPGDVSNTHFTMMLPEDIDDMVQTPGRIEITSALGLVTEHVMTFIPLEELVEIRSDPMRAFCHPWHPRMFCFFGEANRHTLHSWTLDGGWTVEASWLETSTHGPNAGAYYVHQPEPGSTRAESIIEVWADAFATATCYEVLVIKGPKGTQRNCCR